MKVPLCGTNSCKQICFRKRAQICALIRILVVLVLLCGFRTSVIFGAESTNKELEKIEKPAGISNPKDFRNEVVNFVLRATAKNGGKEVKWTSYEKLREVIERKMFTSTEELLPVISFTPKSKDDDQKKHDDFVKRMMAKGYTEKQVSRLVEFHIRHQKSS